jgi:hypothetical protein
MREQHEPPFGAGFSDKPQCVSRDVDEPHRRNRDDDRTVCLSADAACSGLKPPSSRSVAGSGTGTPAIGSVKRITSCESCGSVGEKGQRVAGP